MSDIQIKNKDKAQIFDNKFLALLAKTSPTITLATYTPAILLLFFINFKLGFVTSIGQVFINYFGALLAWTLFEYLMHRYVFHFINDNPFVKKMHYYAHGIHHEFPRDKDHLFLPPVPGIVLATVMYGVFYLAMGNHVYTFLPGFITGYIMYSYGHYLMHTTKPPKSLKYLWKHHSLHHYKYPHKAFGVSNTIWDHVFRTMPPEA